MTGWTTRETAEKCGLSEHTLRWLLSRLRATGMPVRDMLHYAELVRSGAGEQERLALLEGHREHVRQALRQQQECLALLNHKISAYERRLCAARSVTGQE